MTKDEYNKLIARIEDPRTDALDRDHAIKEIAAARRKYKVGDMFRTNAATYRVTGFKFLPRRRMVSYETEIIGPGTHGDEIKEGFRRLDRRARKARKAKEAAQNG